MTAAPGDFDRVEFDGVTVDYGRARVLSRVSFAAAAGSITGLFGPNGAGKTTLLRVAAGRARPSRGEVRYGARAGADAPPVRGRIGWLGHDPGLYPELSAAENLRFFAALHGVPDVDARVAAALEHARLADRGADPVGRFSRGMRQRIGLERALLASPRLVLLDEPFTGLDDASAAALVARLAVLRDAGTIVLLSTHDPARVAGILDARVVLESGRVAAVERLRPEPASDPALDAPAAAAAAVAGGLSGFLRVALLVARKDALVELRSRELALTTLFFAVVAILVFAFAFVRDGRAPVDAPAGILWVTTLFAGTLALARAFDREHANQTLAALLSAPADRAAIYAGKVLGLLALLGVVLAAVVPLVALLFQAGFWRLPWLFAAIVAAGVLGLVAVGSLFAAMLVRTRTRDVLLPVLLYPMVVPVLLASVRGTAALVQAVPDRAVAAMWLSILVSYDAVFLTLALWVFDAVTAED
jgi:heme ABC exporter ATP-binding subunit CcmA/heme exporter protein CcmB